eukprot:CAMPEP_0202887410 /NCGR_PEP_ID=MMETSP1391-20130828/42670_1 /ASSEMBLY_ACC=CAM_ASM_000867 /TAXON_ID=1034604 /ORGANISM="Chlamydomonas leiostraca, Strain SAG 11-49" /LENGTH=80 /DNA_ID=CAMNT_0049570697 /DNA_START=1002 /DNA_END=1246 /DNA_ORIENTATION=-
MRAHTSAADTSALARIAQSGISISAAQKAGLLRASAQPHTGHQMAKQPPALVCDALRHRLARLEQSVEDAQPLPAALLLA